MEEKKKELPTLQTRSDGPVTPKLTSIHLDVNPRYSVLDTGNPNCFENVRKRDLRGGKPKNRSS